MGAELLTDLVAVWHWMHLKKPRVELPFDSNINSCAYVSPDEGTIYYSGAIYGGRPANVTKMWAFMEKCAEHDLKLGFFPLWHDESVLNRYLIDHPPTEILTPSYYDAALRKSYKESDENC